MKLGLIATGIWNSIHLEMAQEMLRRGHQVRIYTEDNRAPSGARFSRFTENGFDFWVIHGFRRNPWTWLPDRLFKYWLGRRFFTSLVAIWRFIRANRDCDLFIVESDWLGFFVAIAACFEPVRWVVGIHDTDYLDAPIDYPGRPHSRWRTKVQGWVLKRADAVRANSLVTQQALVAGACPREKITVVPLHIPGRMLPPETPSLALFRAEARHGWRSHFNIPQDALLLMTMCRLTPVKHLERAVETLIELRRRGANAWLALCGGDRNLPGLGSYAARLAALAQQGGAADRLVLTGAIPAEHVKQALAAADVHLAPSWVDTFNYAVVEAALVGTPTLATTHVGVVPWMGKAVQVLDDDISAWADAALSASAVDHEMQREIIDRLTPGAIAAEVESFYRQAAEPGS